MSEQNQNSEHLYWGPQHTANISSAVELQAFLRNCLAPFEGLENTDAARENAKLGLQQMLEASLATMKARRSVQNYSVKAPDLVHSFRIEDIRNRCRVRMFSEDGKLVHTVTLRGRRKANKVGRSHLGAFFVEYEVLPVRPVYTITCTPIAPAPEA